MNLTYMDLSELSNPDQYLCRVSMYRIGHSELYIRISKADDIRYMCFGSVHYYQGPMRWQGANFSLGDKNLCCELLRTHWLYREAFDDQEDRYYYLYHLFVVDPPGIRHGELQVRVVASFYAISPRINEPLGGDFQNSHTLDSMDAGRYLYQIIRYDHIDSSLIIDLLYNDKAPSALIFKGVEYFQGPTQWRGNEFTLGTQDECLQILRSIDVYANLPSETLLNQFHLFISRIESAPNNVSYVKILANYLSVQDT